LIEGYAHKTVAAKWLLNEKVQLRREFCRKPSDKPKPATTPEALLKAQFPPSTATAG